jgi:DNA-binding NtrC family response regulator
MPKRQTTNIFEVTADYRTRPQKLICPKKVDKRYILVVDDCEKTRDDISCALKKFNYEIITAGDEEEIWDVIVNRRVDLILTELIIYKTTGINLLKKVKLHAPKIGVIILTNHGGVESYLESMSLGVFEYLTKPVKVFELKTIIDRFFHYMEIPTKDNRLFG